MTYVDEGRAGKLVAMRRLGWVIKTGSGQSEVTGQRHERASRLGRAL
jgi:hypothetical protein